MNALTPVSASQPVGPLRSLEELEQAAAVPEGLSRRQLNKVARGGWTSENYRRWQLLDRPEKALQEDLRRSAIAFGWMHYHTHDSRSSADGFPDSVCVRGHRTLFIELKKEDQAVEGAQLDWLRSLMVAGHEVYIVRPGSWGQFVQSLT